MNHKYKLLLLDRDGVINKKPQEGRYVKGKPDLILFDEVLEKVARLTQKIQVAIITNQQGVGKGLMTEDELNNIHHIINLEIRRLGGRDLRAFSCLHKSEEDCACRKPKAGLLLDAMAYYRATPQETLFIGDQESDREAARLSKVTFLKTDGCEITVRHLRKVLDNENVEE
jgi:D-glycero-D-manno-heptose 1,7-bisphosphate phosphatase